MQLEFYSPVDYPALFYVVVVPLLAMLVISLARFAEYRGAWLPNLAAHTPVVRSIILLMLIPLWLYLTYLTILFGYAYGLGVFLVGKSLTPLLYVLLLILLYLALAVLQVRWIKGGLFSTTLMSVLILSLITFVVTSRIAWLCKPLAESGFSFAYGCLARAYEYPGGKGIAVNADRMREWYAKAADTGDSHAAYLVATKTKDPEKRKQLLEIAAKAGHVKAAYHYSNTLGGEEAMHWLTYAAEQELPEALFSLAKVYYSGRSVKQDLAKSRELFLRAAQAGYLPAMMHVTSSYSTGDAAFERNAALSEEWQARTMARYEELKTRRTTHQASMQDDSNEMHGLDYLQHFPAIWEQQRKAAGGNRN